MLLILTFAREEDRDKFEFLYNKYKNLLLHKAYGILGDYMLAEDAVSEAYLRVYKNLDKVEDPASPQSIAFLVTITKNVALTLLQKQGKQPVEPVDEAQEDGFDLEQHILAEISSQQILAVLDGIGEELRSVFLLKFAHDLSHREIGRLLRISENNVTVRLHRAKKKLAQLLVKGGYVCGAENPGSTV